MKDRERIALCLIAGENVIQEGYERMLRSVVGQVDGVFISYNGPIPDDFEFDGSVLQKLQSKTSEVLGDVPGMIAPMPWHRDFSVARNHSFSLINYDPGKYGRFDWILWLDVDDILPEDGLGIQGVIKIANEKRAHGVLLDYEYHYDEERAQVLVSHYKERLFRVGVDWVWVNPIHENCVGPIATPMIRVEGQSVRHLRTDAESKRERNREIVSKWYQENRDEPRAIMYFAHETVAMAEETENIRERTLLYATALRLYREYLEKAPISDDSYSCNRQSAYCLQQLGRFNDAINIDLQGIKMQPLWPASYLGIAETYYRMGEYEMSIDWADRVPDGIPNTTQGVQHLETTYKALMIKGHAAFDAGKYNLSVASFIGAKKIYSDDFVEKMISKARKAQRAESSKEAKRSVRSTLWATGDGHTIAFFVPPGVEEWNRDLINERGSGGTELSVLRLAEHFAEHGWRTVIFGRPGSAENTLDHRGIEWYDTSRFHPDEPFDVFVVLRAPQMLDARINARQIVLWLHDVNMGNVRYGEYGDRFARAHHIIVPSPFHYEHLMRVYGNDDVLRLRLAYIPNGLDRELFRPNGVRRDPNQIVYASSPDRGLLRLLELWPLMQHYWDTRLERGMPKLKIFYGWESIDASIEAGVPQAPVLINFRNRVINRISELRANFEAVEMVGRVNQQRLAEELKKSELMLYPANFLETFGIVFAQAMTAGTIPIVPNLGALPWVVNHPSLVVSGAPESEIFGKLFLQKVRTIRHSSENTRKAIRRELHVNTEIFSWEHVFSTWTNMISEHNRLEAA